MRPLNDTIIRLRAAQARLAIDPGQSPDGRLIPMTWDASNAGDLTAWHYVPERTGPMPLVVVLHGCTQTAAGYDRGAGWSTMARRHGFAVLFPEQQRANNPNLCFNWFVPSDVRRGSGEVGSIRAMVAAMVDRHAIDPTRIFVTGLSAGGAMASALLASYPDLFAGGAIVAGLPFGAAGSMAQAFDRMRGHGHVDAARYADHVRDASDHRGPWPVVSVWHGGGDATVAPGNAEAILGQWRELHKLSATPDLTDDVDGAVHLQWRDGDGRVLVEDYRIAGMGHGTPIATTGPTACGAAAPYVLDVGVSSTWHSAARWGLLDPAAVERAADAVPDATAPDATARDATAPYAVATGAAAIRPAAAVDIQGTIEAALRQVGLMR